MTAYVICTYHFKSLKQARTSSRVLCVKRMGISIYMSGSSIRFTLKIRSKSDPLRRGRRYLRK
jgi:hypothetical protein